MTASALVTRGNGALGAAGCTKVSAPSSRVWETITDIESWPSYHENIQSVTRLVDSVSSKRTTVAGTRYSITKVVHGRARTFDISVAFIEEDDGVTKSMKMYSNEDWCIYMSTITVSPCDRSCQDEECPKGCCLMETLGCEFSCPLGRMLTRASGYPPLKRISTRRIKRRLERTLDGFAAAAERTS